MPASRDVSGATEATANIIPTPITASVATTASAPAAPPAQPAMIRNWPPTTTTAAPVPPAAATRASERSTQ